MALNLPINRRPDLYIVPPVIDFNKFPKFTHQIRVCPVCGKTFKSKIEIFNPSSEQGKYCSLDCKKKARVKSLSNLIDDEQFKKFLDTHKPLIRLAMNSVLGKAKYIDRNNTFGDHYQNCLIALFTIYTRAIRDNKNPYDIKDNHILLSLKHSMMLDRPDIRLQKNHIEEGYIEENTNDEGIANILPARYDIDKILDLRNILSKIVKLAKKNKHVMLTLEKAYLYGDKIVDIEANHFLLKKYNLTKNQFFTELKKGVEHIYYNDRKNIERYIDIDNLKNEYSFNTLTEEELGKDILNILDFYAGIKTCSWCKKRFKATSAQLAKNTAYCSDECKRLGGNAVRKEYKRKQREKHRAPIVERVCIHCGKTFKVRSTSLQQMCSEKCKKKRERILENERRRKKYAENKKGRN